MHKIFVFTFFLAFTGHAQVETGRKVVETLCSPGFHGRGYVMGGDSIAAEYLAKTFKEMGCSFFDENPFQEFSFQVNTFPRLMFLSVQGKTLNPGTDYVVNPASPLANLDSLKVFKLQENDVFDANKLLEIKQLLWNKSTRYALAVDYSFWKNDSLKLAKKTVQELEIKAVIFELVDGKFTWSVSQTQDAFPSIQVQKNLLPIIDTSFVSVRIEAYLKEHRARNVVAYVPAKKKSDKYFVFSAHYDHLGRMGKHTYFPGGNDNASGTAMLLEMARHYVKNPSKVNVVFIAFAGEEVGLLGSHYFTQNPIFPLSQIRFLFNLDIMGSGEEGATIVNATVFPKQFSKLDKINQKYHYLPQIKQRGKAANSDHYFFTEKGVPAFFIYTMGPNKHYHDVADNYENLSFNKFNEIVSLLIKFEKAINR